MISVCQENQYKKWGKFERRIIAAGMAALLTVRKRSGYKIMCAAWVTHWWTKCAANRRAGCPHPTVCPVFPSHKLFRAAALALPPGELSAKLTERAILNRMICPLRPRCARPPLPKGEARVAISHRSNVNALKGSLAAVGFTSAARRKNPPKGFGGLGFTPYKIRAARQNRRR